METALIVVDVNRPSYTEGPELLNRTKTVVILDHHRQSSESIESPVLSYIEPYASSACEMVAEILQYIADGVKLRPIEADAMFAGLMIDTNNFSSKTGVRTFEAAAFLKKSGAEGKCEQQPPGVPAGTQTRPGTQRTKGVYALRGCCRHRRHDRRPGFLH